MALPFRTRLISRPDPLLAICLLLLMTGGLRAEATAADTYINQIKPLLRERCFSCHGALKQEADLRLDTVQQMKAGSGSGPAIVPAKPQESLLLERITAEDIEYRMPPQHEGEPFSAEQVALVQGWIAAGAPAPADEAPEESPGEHWAFQPIVRPAVPETAGNWGHNPIDQFLARTHHEQGLTPRAEADPLIQQRRLFIDLVGVPPSPEEVVALQQDASHTWYEATVDRLIADPRHGQRWARHWMDIWRYSDPWGLNQQRRNSQEHIWHWRDWIVESLNKDLPYDEMIRLMLAADEIAPNDLDKLRATGYLARNFGMFNRPQWMDETVEHVGKGFLGLTFNCARCHDHKYDPIEQEDYYRMRAFFEPYHVRKDVVPGEPDLSRDGVPRVFDAVLDAPTYLYIRGDETQPDKSRTIAPGVPALLECAPLEIEPITLPPEAWQPERREWVLAAHEQRAQDQLKTAQAALEQDKSEPKSAVLQAAVSAAQAQLQGIQRRAAATRALDQAPPEEQQRLQREAVRAERLAGVAEAEHALAQAQAELRKEADNPKTDDKKKAAAEKKVKTAQESLAKQTAQSEAEVKPEDHFTPLIGAAWSTTRFTFSGKDDPPIAFPPKSTGRRLALAQWITDRRNPLTARVAVNHIWTRHMGQPLVESVFDFGRNGIRPVHQDLLDWLSAELIESGWSMKHIHRLIVTSAAYRMSSSVAGAEANVTLDPDNRYLWRREPIRVESQVVRDSLLALAGTLDLTLGGPPVPAKDQESSTRRSLYFFHSFVERNLLLTTFDEAMVGDCYRREQSIVPQQALALANSELVLDAAPQIASRLATPEQDDETFVRSAFAVLLGIEPSEAELAAAHKALAAWQAQEKGGAAQAREYLVWALINHNDFVTLR